MKKIVLKVAAVALCMSGFFAVGAVQADDSLQVTKCQTTRPDLSGECPAPFQVVCCQITSGPNQGTYLGPIL